MVDALLVVVDALLEALEVEIVDDVVLVDHAEVLIACEE